MLSIVDLRSIAFSLYFFSLGLLVSLAEEGTFSLAEFSLLELERQRVALDAELEELPTINVRSDTGTVGYASRQYNTPDSPEWIRIDLGEACLIDTVILLPSLYRDSETVIKSQGFPQEFDLIIGTDASSQTVASFSSEDGLHNRVAPLAIQFPPIEASWIQIEATKLSPRIMDGNYLLQLSEIMVFGGMRNVALGKTVTVSNEKRANAYLSKAFLTDGFSPYVMDSSNGFRSQPGPMSVTDFSKDSFLTIDLQRPYRINQINVHAADLNFSIPRNQPRNLDFPSHLRITGANQADFSDEVFLCDIKQKSALDLGPIITRYFTETQCRYIKVAIVDLSPFGPQAKNRPYFALSEIEVISNDQNIALGATVTGSRNIRVRKTALRKITDGHNYYGKILPTKNWLNQLSRRHDLETKRPHLLAELNSRYAKQKTELRRVQWLAALLAAGILCVIVVERSLHYRQIKQLRKRVAADLHDELGANFHAIGLISQLIEKKNASSSKEVPELLQRIRTIIASSNLSVRHISRLQQSGELGACMESDMKRTAHRIVANMEHQITFEGQEWLNKLSQQARMDLLLFYKECLVNTSRHSGAAQVITRILATPRKVILTVTDNGSGIKEGSSEDLPTALSRRAKLLGAHLQTETPKTGGTRTILTYYPKSRLRRIFGIL